MIPLSLRKVDMTNVAITMCMNIENRWTIDYVHEDNNNIGCEAEVDDFFTSTEHQTFCTSVRLFICLLLALWIKWFSRRFPWQVGYHTRNNLEYFGNIVFNPFDTDFLFESSGPVFVREIMEGEWILMKCSGYVRQEKVACLAKLFLAPQTRRGRNSALGVILVYSMIINVRLGLCLALFMLYSWLTIFSSMFFRKWNSYKPLGTCDKYGWRSHNLLINLIYDRYTQ